MTYGGRVELTSTSEGVGAGGQGRGMVKRQPGWVGRWGSCKGFELHRRVLRDLEDGRAVGLWVVLFKEPTTDAQLGGNSMVNCVTPICSLSYDAALVSANGTLSFSGLGRINQ